MDSSTSTIRRAPTRKFNRGTLGGILLLIVIYFTARYAVAKYRRPGSMSVLEAQGMDMRVMKPPVGAVPVAVAQVQRGAVDARVSYTGSVLAYNDEDVYPRVTGRIVALPVYPGSRVRRGQLLVRLDSDELRARESQALYGREAAEHERMIAADDIRQASAARSQSQAELARSGGMAHEAEHNLGGSKAAIREAAQVVQGAQAAVGEAEQSLRGSRAAARDTTAAVEVANRGVLEAKSELDAAKQARQATEADLADAQEGVPDAQSEVDNAQAMLEQAKARLPQATADVQAMQADLDFQHEKLKRSAALLKQGAISKEEYQQDEAAFRNAEAKVKQATAKVDEANNDTRAAEARLRQTQIRVRQASARVRAATAKVAGRQANIEAATAKIGQLEAEVQQARAKAQQSQADIGVAAARLQQSRAAVAQQRAKAQQTQADVGASAAKVEQALAGVRAAQAMTQSADAGFAKASHETEHAGAEVGKASAELTAASVVRGYTEIRASSDGVVTQRLVAPGVLVNPGTAILKVAQIGAVRFQANVAEQDLQGIRVGMPVTVHTVDDPKQALQTSVSAVFPAADPTSRTAIVEAIAPNADNRFKPGEYVVMDISTTHRFGALKVPSSAIVMVSQPSSDVASLQQQPVVWTMVPAPGSKTIYTCTMHPQIRSDKPGQCPICKMDLTPLEAGGKWRAQMVGVQTGATDGDYTEILSGLREGAHVIYKGYEGLKNNDAVVPTQWTADGPATLPPPGEPAATNAPNQDMGSMPMPDKSVTSLPANPSSSSNSPDNLSSTSSHTGQPDVRVTVTDQGYQPSSFRLRANTPARITFVRTSATTCGTEVLFPDYGIKQALPLNKPVVTTITPHKTGTFTFMCGMKMLKGTVIVQ